MARVSHLGLGACRVAVMSSRFLTDEGLEFCGGETSYCSHFAFPIHVSGKEIELSIILSVSETSTSEK